MTHHFTYIKQKITIYILLKAYTLTLIIGIKKNINPYIKCNAVITMFGSNQLT